MIFSAVGVGPGDPGLVTLKAVNVLKNADLVVLPVSADDRESVAGAIVEEHIRHAAILKLTFPMIRGASERDAKLAAQLEGTRSIWERAERVAMPVLGDAALYATSAYLCDVWRTMIPSLELEIVPGISAHSAISARAGKFLALGSEILAIVPGTNDVDGIERALAASDAVALYKPVALGEKLRGAVENSGPWREILRIDRAGLPGEKILRGDEALEVPAEYLSTLLLWR